MISISLVRIDVRLSENFPRIWARIYLQIVTHVIFSLFYGKRVQILHKFIFKSLLIETDAA
jgi:hypothetical protein